MKQVTGEKTLFGLKLNTRNQDKKHSRTGNSFKYHQYAFSILFLLILIIFFPVSYGQQNNLEVLDNHSIFFFYDHGYWNWYVMGELKNVGETIQNDITVKATLFNESGEIIGFEEKFVYTWDHILPEQKVPLVFLGVLYSDFDESDMFSYSIEVINSTAVDDWQYQDLRIENETSYVDESGIFTVEGDLVNYGSSPAVSYRVIATFYDSEGKVLDSSVSYVMPPVLSTLEPGESYHFTETSRGKYGLFNINDQIADYSLLIQVASPIIPEVSSWTILPLFLIAMLTVVYCRKKLTKQSRIS